MTKAPEEGDEEYPNNLVDFLTWYHRKESDELEKIDSGVFRRYEKPETNTTGIVRKTRFNEIAESLFWEVLSDFRTEDPVFIKEWKKRYRTTVDGILADKTNKFLGRFHQNFKQGNEFFWERVGELPDEDGNVLK